MEATEQQYEEAWCTHLLREQQEVIEKMGKLLRDQQQTIDDLHRALEGKTPQESLNTREYHNGHQLCPKSAAITWLGTIKDMVPISVDGKDYKAIIMTEKLIRALNDAFSATTAFDMIRPQYDEELKFQEKLEKLTQPESKIAEISPRGFPEAEIEDSLKASEFRIGTFRLIWEAELKLSNNAHDYLENYMWKVLKRNNLGVRKRSDFEELKECILESKKAVLKVTADEVELIQNLEVETPSYGSDMED